MTDKEPFDPTHEELEKHKADFFKKGGKVTKLNPPKYEPINGYRSFFYEGIPNLGKFNYYD